jgi:hypothetical protein
MKLFKKIIMFTFASVLLWACKWENKKEKLASKTNFLQQDDGFNRKSSPTYAKDFYVTYHNKSKVMHTSGAFCSWGTCATEWKDVEVIMVTEVQLIVSGSSLSSNTTNQYFQLPIHTKRDEKIL